MTGLTYPDADAGVYVPKAIYYEQADSLEYVRVDASCIYRRIDSFLTLILAIDTRNPIGFRLKGFKYFYNKLLKTRHNNNQDEFYDAVQFIEEIMTVIGQDIFTKESKRHAYQDAIELASVDSVKFLKPLRRS